MINEEVETLRDLEQDIVAAIGYDLETGSHHGNNAASEAFNKRYPRLMAAIAALGAWIDKQEGEQEGYCYHCGYYHLDHSDSDAPAPGCSDYDEYNEGEVK